MHSYHTLYTVNMMSLQFATLFVKCESETYLLLLNTYYELL